MSTLYSPNPAIPPVLQIQSFPYSGGWVNIALALQARLLALPLIGTVHPFTKWVKGNADTEEWQAEFMWERPDGRKVVNAWIINLDMAPPSIISPDDSKWFTRRPSVLVQGHLEIQDPITFDLWVAILGQVQTDLAFGDKTLGGNCNTYQVPPPFEAAIMSPFAEVDCHSVEFKFLVEESGRTGQGRIINTDPDTITSTGQAEVTGHGSITTDDDTGSGTGTVN